MDSPATSASSVLLAKNFDYTRPSGVPERFESTSWRQAFQNSSSNRPERRFLFLFLEYNLLCYTQTRPGLSTHMFGEATTHSSTRVTVPPWPQAPGGRGGGRFFVQKECSSGRTRDIPLLRFVRGFALCCRSPFGFGCSLAVTFEKSGREGLDGYLRLKNARPSWPRETQWGCRNSAGIGLCGWRHSTGSYLGNRQTNKQADKDNKCPSMNQTLRFFWAFLALIYFVLITEKKNEPQHQNQEEQKHAYTSSQNLASVTTKQRMCEHRVTKLYRA